MVKWHDIQPWLAPHSTTHSHPYLQLLEPQLVCDEEWHFFFHCGEIFTLKIYHFIHFLKIFIYLGRALQLAGS